MMEVELPARAVPQRSKAEETPPPSPAAAASSAEGEPLLPGGGCVRRRAVSERFAQRSVSFRREVKRAAAETFLLTRLRIILLRYLGVGYRWIQQFLALCFYTLLLMPGFIQGLKPVVAFITGGAWIIGYKGWGALLGRRLAERAILIACIDSINFPQGTIGDMVEDASQGISFVSNNMASYGGDPQRFISYT